LSKPKLEAQPKAQPVSETYEVTAYTSGYESTGKRPGDDGYGITTSGNRVKEGLTVSCPQELALGTVIDIEGVGERRCDDRGGAINGKRLDLYIADLDRALEFGRRTLKVHIDTK
jgi:3D (Asp-Asp-Asp) domain-containing protein